MKSPARTLRRLGAVCLLAAGLTIALQGAARAQTNEAYTEVSRLLRAGLTAQALARADQHLATQAKDPQMRFLKGVAHSQAGQTLEALEAFTKLTEEYPELPEPYNNLAVIYASQNLFDKARIALEMAVRTNPSYATAHENLGDVYARLAAQSYSRTVQLDTTNTTAPTKLKAVTSLFAGDAKSRASKVGQAPGVSLPQSLSLGAAATGLNVAASGKPTATATTTATVAPATQPAEADIEATVRAWAAAWSARDMAAYLAAYGTDFVAASGAARAQWEAERRARIEPRERIAVSISKLDIQAQGDRAVVRFVQDYESDVLKETDRKTLEMTQNGDRWYIVRETIGS